MRCVENVESVYAALWTEKLNLVNKQCFCRNNKMFYGIRSYNTCLNAVFRHSSSRMRVIYHNWSATKQRWHRPTTSCHMFVVLPIMRCSKLAQKCAVQVCKVATVVIETTQLVLIQFKNFLAQWIENWIRYLSLPKIISKRCGLLLSPTLEGRLVSEWVCDLVKLY